MKASEFDQFAEEYNSLHRANIRLSGEDPTYFAAYKIREVRRIWTSTARPEPVTIVDFGTGIGNSIPHLRELFPNSTLIGVDVSSRCLDIAVQRLNSCWMPVLFDGARLPFSDASADLVFTACVFHHIPHEQHESLLGEIRRILRPGGWLALFEHNPLNPLTRHAVDTCPFDANAVLLGARTTRRRLEAAGFAKVEIRFTAFFPGALRRLRAFEKRLGWLPLGAQYCALARA